jgi:acetate kinase
MKVLVLNSGSSSVKYEVFDVGGWRSLASGLVERIGEPESRLRHRSVDTEGAATEIVRPQTVPDHRYAVRLIAEVLREFDSMRNTSDLRGIGHRVVHGGEAFCEPTLI